uniref:C2H2-type domain-containing protein n=1 Tax=Chenopodium quinoa TaxID=63459 RepID=A0A803M0Y3_CHEQI
MGSARGKYEISAELAIKREMAYREHLELMQLIKSTEAKQVPAPSNPTSVPASRPTSETIQTRPSRIPNPRPKLSENSSPNPTRKTGSSFSVPWPKTMKNPMKLLPRGPSLVPRPIYSSPAGPSSVPRPNFTSQTSPTSVPRPNFTSHTGPSSVPRPNFSSQTSPRLKSVIAGPRPYMPQSPRPSLPWQKTSRAGPNTGPRPSSLSTPSGQRFEPTLGFSHKRKEAPTPTQQFQANYNNNGKMRKLYCEVCEVQCTSFPNLQMHFMGQKHKAQAMEGKGVGRSMKIETRLCCDLCDIWCMNEFSLKQHISGKSHTLKLHTAEKKN